MSIDKMHISLDGIGEYYFYQVTSLIDSPFAKQNGIVLLADGADA